MANAGKEIQEIIGAIITLVVLIYVIAIFASAPGPVGTIFQSIINEIIWGGAIIAIVIISIILLKLFNII